MKVLLTASRPLSSSTGEQQDELQAAHDKVQVLTDQLSAAEAAQKLAGASVSCSQAELVKLEKTSQAAQADLKQQLHAALAELESQQATLEAAALGREAAAQDLLRAQTALAHLQQDMDGHARDNAALRGSLGACQRQSEKFRMELLLAHRSQQSMLTTLEAARHEGNGLRSQLAAQLQVLTCDSQQMRFSALAKYTPQQHKTVVHLVLDLQIRMPCLASPAPHGTIETCMVDCLPKTMREPANRLLS